jgi:VWFA-related protein
MVAALYCGPIALSQQAQAASEPSVNNIYLDVVVASKTGSPVVGLSQPDFTVLDNGIPQAITSFRAVSRGQAPAEVVIVVDAVNARSETVSYERTQIEKTLRANGGVLPYPTTFAIFTEVGTKIYPDFATDGNVLANAFSSETIRLRTLGQGAEESDCNATGCTDAGFDIATERRQLSFKALQTISGYEAARPGRKLVIWISPGWPLLSDPGSSARITSLQRQQMFARLVALTTQLQEARITLYGISPSATRGVDVRDFLYRSYLKGVSNAKNLEPGNLGLQVLAINSGGLVLGIGNDLAELLQKCLADTEAYYEISFAPTGAKQGEYHHLQIQIAKPGLKARTREGYYGLLSTAPKSASISSSITRGPSDSTSR